TTGAGAPGGGATGGEGTARGGSGPRPGSVERGMDTLGAGGSGSWGAGGGAAACALDGDVPPWLISPTTAAAVPPDAETSVVRGEGAEVGKGITTAGSSGRRSDRLSSA